MTVIETEPGTRRLCSLVAKDSGEDPIGSVTSFDRLLALEVPLPWPRNIRAAPRIPAAVEAALQQADTAGTSYRLQGIVPDPEYTPPGLIRLIHLQRPARSLSVFTKEDFVVPPAMLGDLVRAVLTQSPVLDAFAPFREDTTHLRDLLICTHGSRDRCCGSFGFPIYRRLRRTVAGNGPQPSRVWRVSHLGGHRFAPTLLDLPAGRGWAHVDDETLAAILQRDGRLPDLRRHYRGWAALASLPEMVAERAVFAKEGWRWITRTVTSETIGPTDPITDVTEVRLTYADADGRDPGYYDVTIEPTGVVTRGIGSCGDGDLTEHRQYHVTPMDRNELCRPSQRFTLAGSPTP